MVEHQPSKLDTWVRFPSPAFFMPINIAFVGIFFSYIILGVQITYKNFGITLTLTLELP